MHYHGETIQRQSPAQLGCLGFLTGIPSKRTAGEVALDLCFGSTGKTNPCRFEVGLNRK